MRAGDMKIMMYVPSGLEGLLGVGGAEVSTRRLMYALRERGIESAVMVFGYPTQVTGWLSEYPVYFITPHTDPCWHKPRTWASLGRSVLQIHLTMRKASANIVHLQGAWGGIEAFAAATAVPRQWKLVATFHAYGDIEAHRKNTWRRMSSRFLMKTADAVVAVSHSLSREVNRLLSPKDKPVMVISNGLEPFWFEVAGRAGKSDPYILFVGRLDPVKGIDTLIAAWKKLKQKTKAPVSLWLVGDGPEREALEKMVETNGLQESVRFWGALQDVHRLRELYAGSIALVLPSRSEGLPNVLLEAGACGTICVGSRLGGIPEVIVDGETGFLFAPGDADALCDALLRVLALSDAERARMSAQARGHIRQNFSMDAVAERYIEVYRQVLGRCRVKQ
jgi:glycosyltransferase involved in cell wall biosynthesis